MVKPICRVCMVFCCMSGAFLAPAEMVDSVVATVDTEVILYSELMDELGPYLSALRQESASDAAYEQEARRALRDTLEKAIEQKILYREGQLAGHNIPDDVVAERMKLYQKDYGTEEEFTKVLAEAGETLSEFRESLRKQILAISMGVSKRRQLEQEATVSEAEMAQYYQDHLDEFRRPERVYLRRIFLVCGPDKSDSERAKVKARLAAIQDELNAGASFEDMARKYSEGPAASEGGIVGWQSRGELVEELEEVAFSLPLKEVSSPVETQFGYALLQVDQREDAGLASLDEVRKDIEPLLRGNYADERYTLWMNDLKKRSRVRVFL